MKISARSDTLRSLLRVHYEALKFLARTVTRIEEPNVRIADDCLQTLDPGRGGGNL